MKGRHREKDDMKRKRNARTHIYERTHTHTYIHKSKHALTDRQPALKNKKTYEFRKP